MRRRLTAVRASPRWGLLRLGTSATPGAIATTVLLRIVMGALPTLTAVLAGRLVEDTANAVRGRDVDLVVPSVAVLVAYGLSLLLPAVQAIPSLRIRTRVDALVRARTVRVCAEPAAVAHLEDPALRDAIGLVRGAAPQQYSPGSGVNGLFQPVTSVARVAAPLMVLLRWRWELALAVLVVTVASMVLQQVIASQMAQGYVDRFEILRKATYLTDLALSADGAKELRLFGLRSWLLRLQDAEWLSAMKGIWAHRRRKMLQFDVTLVISLGVQAVLLSFVAHDIRHGRLGLAELVAVVSSVLQIGGDNALLDNDTINAGAGAEIVRELKRLEAAVALLTLPGKASASGLPASTVRFTNVSFRYPGTERDLYDGLDLEIRAGESLAIVGANGAGKTTLVKLLARLYDVTSGEITVDGRPVTELDPHGWQQRVACLFQDFTRFPLTLADNVAFGAPALRDDRQALARALDRAGATDLLNRLDEGWDSLLSSAYENGTDLSGGQWQKVALARALLAVDAGAGILVLDEPTAALDAAAEADLYERFLDITAGVTTVLISHRFSTVRKADRIVVLDGGRVIEDGDHHTLLAAGETYARMFTLQADRFRTGAADADADAEVLR